MNRYKVGKLAHEKILNIVRPWGTPISTPYTLAKIQTYDRSQAL